MTMRLSVVTRTKFTLKNLQTQQVHPTQTWSAQNTEKRSRFVAG